MRSVHLAGGVLFPWVPVKQAMAVRNIIIHGGTRLLTPPFVTESARRLIDASLAVHTFARKQGFDLDRRIVRVKPRIVVKAPIAKEPTSS